MATLSYSVASDTLGGVLFEESLSDELSELELTVSISCVNTCAQEDWIHIELDGDPSPEDAATISAVVSSHGLDAKKQSLCSQIDKRTDELIDEGFVYGLKKYSCSLRSQAKAASIHQFKDDPDVTYPIKWNTRDNRGAGQIVSGADLEGFFKTALGTVRYHVDSGTALKDLVRSATTMQELDAIKDDR